MQIVRDSQKVWPHCTDCGCRLKPAIDKYNDSQIYLSHYEGFYWGEDARGCRCKMVRKAWVVPKNRIYSGMDILA